MAEQTTNPEEQALRRRARRRLVGSLALALLAVVVLPMIFEPEPKPLGDDVEIIIPGQDSPFVPTPASAAPAQSEPVITNAPEILPPPTPANDIKPADKPETPAAKPTPAEAKPQPKADKPEKPEAKSEKAPAKTDKVEAKPAAVKPGAKASTTAADKPSADKPEQVRTAEPMASATSVSGDFFLQLGAFGAEANARQLADKVKAGGFPVRLLAGQGGHKVRVGPYSTRDKAVDAQNRLKAKGFSPVLVAP
jgi:DedD protein